MRGRRPWEYFNQTMDGLDRAAASQKKNKKNT